MWAARQRGRLCPDHGYPLRSDHDLQRCDESQRHRRDRRHGHDKPDRTLRHTMAIEFTGKYDIQTPATDLGSNMTAMSVSLLVQLRRQCERGGQHRPLRQGQLGQRPGSTRASACSGTHSRHAPCSLAARARRRSITRLSYQANTSYLVVLTYDGIGDIQKIYLNSRSRLFGHAHRGTLNS